MRKMNITGEVLNRWVSAVSRGRQVASIHGYKQGVGVQMDNDCSFKCCSKHRPLLASFYGVSICA